jgi:two-component system, cell cycle sensor histidine kinase and response regulator CckA
MNSFVPSCANTLTPAKESSPALIGLNDWEAKQTVLLVEDEPFVRSAVAEAVESAGYKVLTASSAAEALEVYRNGIEAIDLLLADVVMPDINGHDLARKVLAFSPHTEVLLMSGYEEQLIRYEESLEAIDFLAKPFSIPTLLQRIRGLLSRRPARHHPAPA